MHPILSGMFGFIATIIGSYFFKIEKGVIFLVIGAILFLFANQLQYKFKFNSYNLNGATITTIVIFLSQII
jgi:hypothetical protein